MPEIVGSARSNLTQLVGKIWVCPIDRNRYQVTVSDLAQFKLRTKTGTGIERTAETQVATIACPCGQGTVEFNLDLIGTRDETTPYHSRGHDSR